MGESSSPIVFTWQPVTADRWDDFEQVFGVKGAMAGCWCMWWRLTRKEFDALGGSGRREAMRQIILSGRVPGILAYAGGVPAGWCSIAPREEFSSLERSRVLARVDDQPVWSLVCFYIRNAFRRKGLMNFLVQSALEHARRNGARIVEAYPTCREGRLPPVTTYQGLLAAFSRQGFIEVARRSDAHAVMRYDLAGNDPPRPEI